MNSYKILVACYNNDLEFVCKNKNKIKLDQSAIQKSINILCYKGYIDLLEYLLTLSTYKILSTNHLLIACEFGQIDIFDKILEMNSQLLNETNITQFILVASTNGHIKLVQHLLNRYNINKLTNKDIIYNAYRNNHEKIVYNIIPYFTNEAIGELSIKPCVDYLKHVKDTRQKKKIVMNELECLPGFGVEYFKSLNRFNRLIKK